MKPLISVVVPVYKVELYLSKCVESLLCQDYPDLEIILVDDGSPDKCGHICDKYAERYKNIVSFHKANGGLGDARNYGVEHANGDYIAFVDSDDYVEPSYISDMWSLLEENECDLVMTRLVRELENSKDIKNGNKFEPFIVGSEEALFEAYSGIRVGWSACAKLYKKSMLIQYPFPKGYYEDCAIMYKIIYSCKKIAIADYENNYHYVERDGSILKSKLEEKHLHIFDICEEFDDFMNDEEINDPLLSVTLYRRAVTQILNLQSMDKDTYNAIFFRYRSVFRKNLVKTLKDSRLSFSVKVYTLLLCTSPSIYKFQTELVHKARQ